MLLGKEVLDEDKVSLLIYDIKKKKELKELSNDFVKDKLFKYLQKEHKSAQFLIKSFNQKSSSYKQIVKDVRAQLRKVYGLFRADEEIKKKSELIEKLLETSKGSIKRKKIIEKILATHASTRERLSIYDELYKKIFTMTGKPKTILDLGCGINPFSLHYMKLRKVSYYVYDISEEEINNLNQYFQLLHNDNHYFFGEAEVLDILHWLELKKKLKKAEVCFLFKMTDVLDRNKGHKVTENVIQNIPAKFVVVSFPTKTMSGKKMNFPRRKWIELMCRRLSYHYRTLVFENEIFYVIEKINK
ncbi:MAG: hypothetical protein ABH824_06605 [Nanoarchaeota archaeon]|nr:hypothetical protein [Nanoarchaeota archaeon]MBU1632023.1 hypothetical protein [Nanoarchaeota archaeon]MBU1875969.1 hypothetical protein [Nanoarchaeota archaeon]